MKHSLLLNESNENLCNDDSLLRSFGEVSGRDCRQARQIKETGRNSISCGKFTGLLGYTNRLLQVYDIS